MMLESLRDQVYGIVEIHPLCNRLINLPEFQRLRDIKQLSNLNYIYPCATHDRFQHCIGVYHLAEVFIERLKNIQPELQITEEEKLCVSIGGLLHDIGHITLGHLYPLYTRFCNSTTLVEHEMMSCRIFYYIIEKYDLMSDFSKYNLNMNHIHLICEIIMGDREKVRKDWTWIGAPHREFLLQIVSNAQSGVDVDRFDYMLRDCLYLGLNCSYDYECIMKGARCIVNDEGIYEICFDEKVNIDVFELFQCRMSLHRRAYNHPSNRLIDIMVIEALRSAEQNGFRINTKNDAVPLSQACTNIDAYIRSTDYILLDIKNSVCAEYEEARSLIQLIEKKEMYPFVGEIIINSKLHSFSTIDVTLAVDQYCIENYIKQYFVREATELGGIIDSKDIALDILKVNYGMNNSNPLQRVSFFRKTDPNVSFHLPLSPVTNILSEQSEYYLVRIYCHKRQSLELCCQLFSKWKNVIERDMDGKQPDILQQITVTFPSTGQAQLCDIDLAAISFL